MNDIDHHLGPDGALAGALPGFQPREEQQALGRGVAEAIDAGETLIAEAGTGTGKTFAYLLPALLSGKRVIVSTGTKTLQDQLYQKDLPLLRDALDLPRRTALLKGRTNYLCLYRTDLAEVDARFDRPGTGAQLQAIRQWAAVTDSGDISELAEVPNDAPIWGRATSTADNCLGQECPLYDDCFLMAARRRAQEADLLVVNHHLLLADMALKEGGFGEVLPSADAYILDEAHQLPDVAAQFFGVAVSSRQLQELIRDTHAEYLRDAGDQPALPDCLDVLRKAVQDFRLTLGEAGQRAAWNSLGDGEEAVDALIHLRAAASALAEVLETLAERGRGLENCYRRARDMASLLDRFADGEAEAFVQWFETYQQAFILRLTPLDVGQPFQARMKKHPAAWVFTSATLSVNEGFDHFLERMGLDRETSTLRVDSPFDYASNALLYAPAGMPEPNSPFYTEAFIERAEAVIRASGGRAFVLFTSHRALQQAAALMRDHLPYPVLVQGDASQNLLLERFREAGNAVLLGTGSFWEGVDVKGEALSAVIIDRLPFASPADPVTQARIDFLRRHGGNPFRDFQIPQAVIALRQGVGRLIRDASDYGVLMIGDPRLTGKSYGRLFLNSLPPMRRTRDLEAVQAFLARAD
ncbi:ATP-dependent DNA helicase [Aquisalimonas asiatica]|uniref:DNA 5'-3' helicase n=1 Tax=Aquisalimonas asiatica TaxID=406100 RepID=A0A1H8SKP8_9GAMM|nr:ATP-dependent DNA helicase [Aquisalimonas asiatica]SEO78858.1 ATP-dependent DNA helicase DinG [Aquisalimonas asiatica]